MTAPKPSSSGRASRIEPVTRLATGGMADIWLARETGAAGLERFVVVKRLLPHLAREREIVDMFLSEARFIARLVHPNVVLIHDLGEDDEGYFLVMEYVAGCSVRELLIAAIEARTKLPLDAAVSIVEQACRGAHAAHELADPAGKPLGLVHRDISPHNLMIGPSGDVKLLDFGIAKATASAEATRTGTLKGKHGYMSPEQCHAARVDRRSDVFALGIVCWELITGERLFKRDNDFATMNAIVSGQVRPPSSVRADLPAAFDAVIVKALALEVADRWQTADAFRRALTAVAYDCGMRPSRDALAAVMVELLGARLDERELALRDASHSGPHPDPVALRDVLVHSDTSPQHDATSTGGTDAVATVIQRSSKRPAAAQPADDVVTAVTPAHEVTARTVVDAADTKAAAPAPSPATERSPETPRAPRRLLLFIAAPALAAAALIVAFAMTRGATADRVSSASSAVAPAERPSSSARPVPAGATLRFVVAPTIKPDVIRSELKPFLEWLGDKHGRPIELVIAASYDDTGEMVASGQAQVGWLPPLLLVRTLAREPRVQPLVVRLFDGSRTSDGYLVTRGDKPVPTPAALRGLTICHVDRDSTTGYLLPRIWLRQQGLDPDKDVKAIFSGNHLAAMRDLIAGKCDAATVYSGAFLTGSKDGIEVGRLSVMAVTGHVPQDALVAAPDMPAAEVARLRDALVDFQPQRDIDAGRIGEVLGVSGFAEYAPAEFDTIRAAAEHEGLVPKRVDAGR